MIDRRDTNDKNEHKDFLKSHGFKSKRNMEEINIDKDSETFIRSRNFIKAPEEIMKSMFSNITCASYSEIEVIFNILSKKQNGQELSEEDKSKLYSFTDRLKSAFNSSVAGIKSREGMFAPSLK